MKTHITKESAGGVPNTILTTNDVTDVIARLAFPVSQAAEKHVRDLIEITALSVRELNAQFWFEGMERTKAAAQYLRDRVRDTLQALADARRDLENSGPVNGLKLVVCFVCWLVCIAGEFTITWETLPFALNVPLESFLGVAIGAVPVAALTVVEWILARGVEQPYQEALKAIGAASRWRRWSAMAVMGIFLILLLAGNIQTIRWLAHAREESAKLRHNVMAQSEDSFGSDSGSFLLPVDYKIINRAIIAVSVAVVVDGALLFLLGMQDWEKFSRRIRARIRVAWNRRRNEAAEKLLFDSQPIEQAWVKVWEGRDKRGEIIQAEFCRQHLVKLQEVLDRKPPEPSAPSIEDLVNQVLAAPIRGMEKGMKVA